MSSQQPAVGNSSPPREAHGSLVHAEEENLFNIPQSEATGQKSTDMEEPPFLQQQVALQEQLCTRERSIQKLTLSLSLPPSIHKHTQFQSDWQAKLEQLQNQHKQESLQQQKEHIEQLRLLQAQIMNELRMNSSVTSEQAPSTSIRVSDAPSLRVSHSMDLIRESSSSPLSAVEGEKISEKSQGLSRAHSISDPQLSRITTSQTLSLNSSPVKAHSTNHTPVSSPPCATTKSPSQPMLEGGRAQGGQNQAERVDSSDFSAGHSFGFYQPATTTSSAALVRTSTTESLDQSSAATSIDASPIKLDDDQMKLTLSDVDDDDDNQSLNIIPRMSPQLKSIAVGGGSISSSMSPPKPPQRRLVWMESNQQSSTPAPSLSISTPATKLTVKTSPVAQSIVAPTPVYPAIQLSPMYSSAVSPHSIRLSPGNANVTLTSPSTFNRGSVVNESLSRATLMEKHKKHMDDLKLYYESELLHLRKKLDTLESDRTDPSATSTRRSLSPLSSSFTSTQRSPLPTTPKQSRQMYFPSSLMKGRSTRTPTGTGKEFDVHEHRVYLIITGDGNSSGGERSPSPSPAVASSMVNESELWMLQSENARLKGECSELRGRLDQGQREKHALEEQVKRLKEHTVRHQHIINMSLQELYKSHILRLGV